MTDDHRRTRRFAWLPHLAAALLLAGFVALLYWPLLFTNRVLATGDILLYFYPHRDFVAEALRAGRLPFWNPYLFSGAPLLANTQAAVLYPFHWPLIWLSVTDQVYWSVALHTWLFGYGGYWLLRRWGYGAGPALITGLVLAGSGLIGGLIGHLNQLNVAAWLPWAVLCLPDFTPSPAHSLTLAQNWPRVLRRGALLGLIVALMLLAGHTQTFYISLFALGIWAIWPGVTGAIGSLRQADGGPRFRIPHFAFHMLAARLVIYILGVVLGALIAAPQLLLTLELNGLGLRSGGLSYLDATSFSLKPLQLLWTLLPSYGLAEMSAVFDTPAYTEYIAYVGLLGLALAIVGAWRGRGPARAFGVLFAVLGLLLALGRWNPLYFVLYTIVPGFDLFRVPARWMLIFTLGVGILAGVGAAWVAARWGEGRIAKGELRGARGEGRQSTIDSQQLTTRGELRIARGELRGARGEGRQSTIDNQQLTIDNSSSSRWAPVVLALLVAAELLLAARALPHTQPTAPQAVYDLRTAPAHLLTDPGRTPFPGAAGRFLGMSTITYDPGDMADYRRIFLDTGDLTPATFADLVIAQKVQELIVPNLSLLWRIPALDGFDGGLLPLQRYNLLAQLLAPADQLAPDGRLREQIRTVPASDLLNRLDVQHLITDKVRDLWFEDVYYDRQIGAQIEASPSQFTIPTTTTITAPLPFNATHLDLIAALAVDAATAPRLVTATLPVAAVTVADADGAMQQFTVTGGGAPGSHLADDALDSPLAVSSGAVVAWRDVEGGRQEYRVRLPLPAPMTATTITVTALDPDVPVLVQAATLYDARTGMFSALLPSDRGRFARVHSGDVKIYENLDRIGRAYLVATVITATTAADALALLDSGLPPDAAVVEGGAPLDGPSATAGTALINEYAAERIVVATESTQPALLVLSDAFYPGWQATVDGAPAAILPTNVLYRGVYVPAGAHTVTFTYEPTGWRSGLAAAGGGLLLALLAVIAASAGDFRRRRRTGV
jgi:hypothetical protein